MLEYKDGRLYTSTTHVDGFVPGVPVAPVRICDGKDFQTIYEWGDDVLTFDGVIPHEGESAAIYDSAIPEIPKG